MGGSILGVNVWKRAATGVDRVWVYGNSFYFSNTSGNAYGVWFNGADVANSIARNNLLVAPSIAGRQVYVDSGTGNTGSNNTGTGSDPGWATYPPTVAAHVALALGSGQIDAGYTVPALADYAGKSRIGLTYDIGAYEYGASDPVPSGVGTRLVLVRRN